MIKNRHIIGNTVADESVAEYEKHNGLILAFAARPKIGIKVGNIAVGFIFSASIMSVCGGDSASTSDVTLLKLKKPY